MIIRLLKYMLLTILTSFYLFPFEFIFLPGINTKMIMAALGVVIIIMDFAQARSITLNKDILIVVMISLGIFLTSFLSMSYNSTNDPSFLTYPVSMFVWLGGAYCLIRFISVMDDNDNIVHLCNYIIIACTAQCIIAYIASINPAIKAFIDSFLGGENAFMGKAEGRLYGIGAALDPSGQRFSAALCMITYIGCKFFKKLSVFEVIAYLVSFAIIAVIGNMMARSTTMGLVISLLFMIVFSFKHASSGEKRTGFVRTVGISLLVLIPICVALYRNDVNFRHNIRFGFEGFFSLAETGKWQTNSTDILTEDMIVFPETMKTWIIGDGYGANPYDLDQYYVGEDFHGFYMATDIGYLRFIFYFGVIGMLLLIAYISKVALTCVRAFPAYTWMFLMILGVNLAGWFKVSTDIFLVFAPFLCLCLNGDYEDHSFQTPGNKEIEGD